MKISERRLRKIIREAALRMREGPEMSAHQARALMGEFLDEIPRNPGDERDMSIGDINREYDDIDDVVYWYGTILSPDLRGLTPGVEVGEMSFPEHYPEGYYVEWF